MKRIAIISDIHGNIEALKAVVNDIEKRQITEVVNLGDHISGPLWPKETIQFLMQQDWIQIAGNHDRNLVNKKLEEMNLSDQYAIQFLNDIEKEWLRALPETLKQDGLYMFHATPEFNNIYLLEIVEKGIVRLASSTEIKRYLGDTDSQIILCGHSHIPRIIDYENSVIVNAGRVGLQAYDDVTPEYHTIETGSHHARYVIIEYDEEKLNAEIVAVEYNYQKAVDQALKNNRLDWAKALKTGRI